MPFVRGYLRIARAGHADQDLPGHEGETDPGWGIEEGSPPGVWGLPGHDLPSPPPGVWPPPSLGRPVVPAPAPPISAPPGSIWPPAPGAPNQNFYVVVGIPGVGWRYAVLNPGQVWPPLPPTTPTPR